MYRYLYKSLSAVILFVSCRLLIGCLSCCLLSDGGKMERGMRKLRKLRKSCPANM